MMIENPEPIQDLAGSPVASSGRPAPLILIHDGSGTTFSYYFLGDLGRPVFGIHNPNFHSGKPWVGGLPEMAKHYIALVRAAVPRGGPVLLGGWSLGGMLALEMARQLAADRDLRVRAVVMIDSPCPLRGPAAAPRIARAAPYAVSFSPRTRPETRDAVLRCFAHAREMVARWDPPAWGPAPPLAPPPVALLRAADPVPAVGDGVADTDAWRADRLLGWGRHREGLVGRVVDIPGHHFSVFAEENLDEITESLRTVCRDLDA